MPLIGSWQDGCVRSQTWNLNDQAALQGYKGLRNAYNKNFLCTLKITRKLEHYILIFFSL